MKHFLNPIDDAKYDGSTQICGIPKSQHDELIEIERAHDLGVCKMAVLGYGVEGEKACPS